MQTSIRLGSMATQAQAVTMTRADRFKKADRAGTKKSASKGNNDVEILVASPR